jgi:ACS family tartrate transporter-like MFS transporter
VFIVEGAPAVLLGLVVPFLLPDRPRDAKWLTAEEREWLTRTLHEERRQMTLRTGTSLGEALRHPNVWLLAFGILTINVGGYGVVFWLATVVKGLLGAAGMDAGDTAGLLWTGFIFLIGMAGIYLAGWSSDRRGERKWHCVAGLVGAGVFFALSAVPDQPWAAVFLWLCLAGFCGFFWIPPYWVLPTLATTSSAAAVSIGVINICANSGGFIGNTATGYARDAGVTNRQCLALFGACYVVGALLIAFVRVPPTHPNPSET